MNRNTESNSLPTGPHTPVPSKTTWVTPRITELPRLNEITLQSGGIPGGGGTGGGGSTVVP